MKFLPNKTRQTILEIDLDAVLHNFKYFKNLVEPSTKFIMVIKAFAYGAGIKQIAKLLDTRKIEYLAVACIDEGVELKDAGIDHPIMILNAEWNGFQKLIEYGLEPVIHDLDSFVEFKKALKTFGSYHKPYPIHLKVDTGMHRLGFSQENLPDLLKNIIDSESLIVKSIMSHLVASGDSKFDNFTNQQIHLFEKMSLEINSILGYKVNRHILNSGGIERFPQAQYDMVRLGIGLYGLSAQTQELKSVYSWRAAISQITEVKKGESVSYNRSWIAKRDSRIATVFVGYADGLSRALGNEKWHMKHNGKKLPIVGDICMDSCMVDVTDSHVKNGDELIIFENQQEVSQMAAAENTIHYEVLTRISKRVNRVYKKS